LIDLRILSVAVPLVAAAADLLAVVVVLVGARDRRTIVSLSGMVACMALWNTRLGLESIPGFPEAHPTILLTAMLGITVLPATAFHFACVSSGTRNRWLQHLVLAGYGFALLLCWLAINGLITDGFIAHSWGSVGRHSVLYPAFVAFLVLSIGSGYLLCLLKLRDADGADGPSPPKRLPSSHCSSPSITPLPQRTSTMPVAIL
jgi:hypothetical protein